MNKTIQKMSLINNEIKRIMLISKYFTGNNPLNGLNTFK